MSTVRQRKSFGARMVKFDRDGSQGSFICEFAKLNVIDKDGDVLLPGILGAVKGEGIEFKVRIASWGHKWQELPVGRGEVYEQDGALFCEGKFFLDTTAGLETYKTVKGLAELAEWSFGFDILASEPGQFQGRNVRFLKSVSVFEVSPVLQGAGIDTHTVDMKSDKKQWSTAAVYEAWSALHPYEEGMPHGYVAEVFIDPNTVIICMGDEMIQMPFSVSEYGDIEFDEEAAVAVERTYIQKSVDDAAEEPPPSDDAAEPKTDETNEDNKDDNDSKEDCTECGKVAADCECDAAAKQRASSLLLDFQVTQAKLLGVIE